MISLIDGCVNWAAEFKKPSDRFIDLNQAERQTCFVGVLRHPGDGDPADLRVAEA